MSAGNDLENHSGKVEQGFLLSIIGRHALWIYALIILIQSFYFFFTFENYPYAGISGTDQIAYYAPLRSLFLDHDLNLHNELYDLNFNKQGLKRWDSLPRSPHYNQPFSRYPIGYALLLSPFFLIAHGLTSFLHPLRFGSLAPDGYSLLYEIFIVLNTVFWACCAFWSLRRLLQNWCSCAQASLITLVLMLSYQGSYYTIWSWANTHIAAFFIVNLMLLLSLRMEKGKTRAWEWLALGGLTGVATLMRTEQAVLILMPLLIFLWKLAPLLRSGDAKSASALSLKAAMVLPAFMVAFYPQIIAWERMWGAAVRPEWLFPALSSFDVQFNWTRPVLFKILFIPYRGLFYWSPILLIGAVGLVAHVFSRAASPTARIGFIQLVALYYVYASWSIWDMGYSYGARGFISLTGILAIGLAVVVRRFAHWSRTLLALGVLLVVWNQAMLWMFLNGYFSGPAGLISGSDFGFFLPLRKLFEKLMEMR